MRTSVLISCTINGITKTRLIDPNKIVYGEKNGSVYSLFCVNGIKIDCSKEDAEKVTSYSI